MEFMGTASAQSKKSLSSHITLWLILLACVLPVALSSLIWWQGWGPLSKTQAGILVEPVIRVTDCVKDSSGAPLVWPESLKRKWVLLVVDPHPENDFREFLTQQLRTMQGKERERVARASLLTLPVIGPTRPRSHEMLQGSWCSQAFSQKIRDIPEKDRVYIVDPKGNLMMVFDSKNKPKALHKDLTKLLLVSQIG